MPSSFTSSQQKQTQNFNQQTTLPGAGQVESALQDQLFGLAGNQARSLTAERALQNALMNPHETLLQLQQPAKTKAEIETAMRQRFGNNLVDRFNKGGGTGKGLTPAEFQAIFHAQRDFARSDLRDMGQDLIMKLQQQVAQNQMGQEAQAQFLDRLQNPFGLSTQEQQGIENIFNNQRTQAQSNLKRGMQDIATGRGLNLSDSPVANETARQLALLESNLGAAQSAELLNRGMANRDFGLNLITNNANLAQMGFGNRTGLSQILPSANTFLQPLLAQNRFAQPNTTGSGSSMATNTPSGFDVMMRGIGAAGGLMMGAGLGLGGLGLGGAASSGAGAAGLAGGGSLQGAQMGFNIPTFKPFVPS